VREHPEGGSALAEGMRIGGVSVELARVNSISRGKGQKSTKLISSINITTGDVGGGRGGGSGHFRAAGRVSDNRGRILLKWVLTGRRTKAWRGTES